MSEIVCQTFHNGLILLFNRYPLSSILITESYVHIMQQGLAAQKVIFMLNVASVPAVLCC